MAHPVSLFFLGAIAMACLTASVFFLRFWKETRDRLFLMFSLAFALETVNRSLLAWQLPERYAHFTGTIEGSPGLYVLRLLAYVLILGAVIDKNRHSSD